MRAVMPPEHVFGPDGQLHVCRGCLQRGVPCPGRDEDGQIVSCYLRFRCGQVAWRCRVANIACKAVADFDVNGRIIGVNLEPEEVAGAG